MLIFIDESGIHKSIGKSSVALVYVTVESVENIEQAIIEAEKKLNIVNFHWPNHIWKIRFEFVKLLMKENFNVKAAIVENPFNEDIFEQAIKALIVERKIKNIVIDGKKPKWYLLRLKKVLRDYGISVKKIRTADDKAYPILRLADAFAGLVRIHWDEPDNQKAKELYKLASKKIKTTQLVGGQVAK